MQYDLIIIGAGAAGLASAIFAAQSSSDKKILLLEGSKQPGTKILVSGGGRCNVTHSHIHPRDDFFGSPNIVRNILAAFDESQTVEWFKSLGVTLKTEETGKLFPTTDDAKTVLDAMLYRARDLTVDIRANHRVTRISPLSLRERARVRADATNEVLSQSSVDPSVGPHPDSLPEEQGEIAFSVETNQGTLITSNLILATGGRSLPRTGSDGSGYDLAKSLGHTVTETHPALVPLAIDGSFFHAQLSGLSQIVELTTFVDQKKVDQRTGSLLWTHFGVSGPIVMDASRFTTIARDQNQKIDLRCNFIPRESPESTEAWLLKSSQSNPKQNLITLLSKQLPTRFVEALLAHLKIGSTTLSHLSRDTRRVLANALTNLQLPAPQSRGWNYAEVTAGGVPLSEINFRTMESRKQRGLYLVGEILDNDGRIGGYNFQWAWATAFIAGRAVSRP